MTDDALDKQPQPGRRRRAPDDPASPTAPPGADDPQAALERLQSLTSATAAPPAADSPFIEAAPFAEPSRPVRLAPGAARPRPAASPRVGRMVARVVAPVVFLAAVVVLLSILSQSGIVGGKADRVPTPTPVATKTKAGGSGTSSTIKVYVVKSGDTLSGIANKFGTTASEIEALNPKFDSRTLVIGTKLKVPRQAP